MADPFHVHVFGEVELANQVGPLLEFVENNAVIDAVDGDFPTRFVVEQFPVAADDFAQADALYAGEQGSGLKIGTCLLLFGLNLEQNHIFCGMLPFDQAIQEVDGAVVVEATEVGAELRRDGIMLAVDAVEQHLVAEQRRESLHFDHLWKKAAGIILTNGEIDDHGAGLAFGARDPLVRGNGGFAGFEVGWAEYRPADFVTGREELLGEVGGYKDGAFGHAEVYRLAQDAGKIIQKALVACSTEMLVDGMPDVWMHQRVSCRLKMAISMKRGMIVFCVKVIFSGSWRCLSMSSYLASPWLVTICSFLSICFM